LDESHSKRKEIEKEKNDDIYCLFFIQFFDDDLFANEISGIDEPKSFC
jgi:hypothetical protein